MRTSGLLVFIYLSAWVWIRLFNEEMERQKNIVAIFQYTLLKTNSIFIKLSIMEIQCDSVTEISEEKIRI